jgi:hypothetical protein
MPDRKRPRKPPLVLGVLPLAFALAFGGCGGTTEVVKTVTVDRPVIAGSDPAPSTPSKKRKEQSSEGRATRAAPSGYVSCDANIDVKAATTTCAFAQNAFWQYWTSGESDAIQVYSPAASSTFKVSCTVRDSQIGCSTTDGGEVRFSQAALDLYSQTQADAYAGSHDLGPDPYGSLPPPESAPYNPDGDNIPNYENGNGYRVQCNDGMYSQSGGIQGACSGHGGVAE